MESPQESFYPPKRPSRKAGLEAARKIAAESPAKLPKKAETALPAQSGNTSSITSNDAKSTRPSRKAGIQASFKITQGSPVGVKRQMEEKAKERKKKKKSKVQEKLSVPKPPQAPPNPAGKIRDKIENPMKENPNILTTGLFIWIFRSALKLGADWEMRLDLLEAGLAIPGEDAYVSGLLSRLLMDDRELGLLGASKDGHIPLGFWKNRLAKRVREWIWKIEILQKLLERSDDEEESVGSSSGEESDDEDAKGSLYGDEKQNGDSAQSDSDGDDPRDLSEEDQRKRAIEEEYEELSEEALREELDNLNSILRHIKDPEKHLKKGPKLLEEMGFEERARLLLALCEDFLSHSNLARAIVVKTNHEDMRPSELGQDSLNRVYYHFHQFLGSDRLYRTAGAVRGDVRRDRGVELVAEGVEPLRAFARSLSRSAKKKEQELAEHLLENLVPHMEEEKEAVERKEAKEEKMRLLMAMPRRRSSRNAITASFDQGDGENGGGGQYGTLMVSGEFSEAW